MKTSGIHQFLPVSEADRKTNIGGAKRKLYEGLTQDMGKRSLKKWKDRKPRDNDNEISPAQVELNLSKVTTDKQTLKKTYPRLSVIAKCIIGFAIAGLIIYELDIIIHIIKNSRQSPENTRKNRRRQGLRLRKNTVLRTHGTSCSTGCGPCQPPNTGR